MAIQEKELLGLQPGDMIQIISEDEARLRGHWYGEVSGWYGVDGRVGTMNDYCGKYLTVKRISEDEGEFVRTFVEESDYWWKADFIDHIVHEEYEAADDRAIMELIFS